MKSTFIVIIILLFGIFISFGQTVKQKIACVGNSITYGYGLSSPATQSYPSQMQMLLGTTNWEVGNFGVSSRTMLKKGDKPYWVEAAFTNSKAFSPNIVMIELGTNDAKTTNWNPYGKEFVANYKEMIQVFQNLQSKPEVWIGLIPPGQYIKWNILFGYIKDSVNTRIKEIAIESGIGLIDIFDALSGNSIPWFSSTNFQVDSIHPKVAGAAIIAQKVKEMITMEKPQITYSLGKLSVKQAFGYQWYYNGTPVSENDNGNFQTFTPTKTGKYKVLLKINATNESRIVSNEFDLSTLYSSLVQNKTQSFNVFPNPIKDGFINILSQNTTGIDVTIYDSSGKICFQKTNIDNTLDLKNLNTGIYLLDLNIDKLNYRTKLLKL